MFGESTAQQCDVLLSPFLNATSEAESESLLTSLLEQQAGPVIKKIIRSKLEDRLRGQEAEDVYCEVVTQLVERLRLCKGTPTKLLVFTLVVLIFGITITAFTQRESGSGTFVQLCVKANGQLRMTDKTTACDSSERLVEWLVGGQVTDIRAGQGLISNRDDGVVNLAVDPTVFQGCAGCGKIIAGFNDGPLELPRFVIGEEIPQIAKLDLPAGNYAIFAKLVVTAKQQEEQVVTVKEFAQCNLSAGNDFDNSSALLEVEDDRPIAAIDNDRVVLSLEVVHRFAEPGEAILRCSKGVFAGDSPMQVHSLKIIAMESGNISNVFLGGN